MRLVSFAYDGETHVGIESEGRIFDLSAAWPSASPERVPQTVGDVLASIVPLRDLFERRRSEAVLWRNRPVQLRAPLRPGKIVAIGLNYRDHALEQAVPFPETPLIFAKFSTAVIGPGEAVHRPPFVTQLDYEAELAVVIGRLARRVDVSQALSYVAGYTCMNDVSARDLQFKDGQWVRGKSLDTLAPIGPALVTPDEIPDPGKLPIRCRVNGELRQDSSTSELIFSVPQLIAFCSRMFTLEPGDMIATGTPAGVGVFRKPPRFLQPGDQVEVEIEGVGRLVNPVVADGEG